mgnify:CR=1 FL=1
MGTVKQNYYSAHGGGFRSNEILDINAEELTELCEAAIYETDRGKIRRPLLIWGAPGVGKTSTMKKLIKAYNETQTDAKNKKSIITIDCGFLTQDGFSVPGIIQNADGTGQSTDLIKTWLPVWKPTGDDEKDEQARNKANTFVVEKVKKASDKQGTNKKGQQVVSYEYEEVGNGGIIFFDELLRANADVFKVIMNLVKSGAFTGGYVLGDKWTIICGSSRPLDDIIVAERYKTLGAAFKDRFVQYNYMADKKSWDTYMVKEKLEGFSLGNLGEKSDKKQSMLMRVLMRLEQESGLSATNIETEIEMPEDDSERSQNIVITWRTWTDWAYYMTDLMARKGYSKFEDIPEKEYMLVASGIVGKEYAKNIRKSWLKVISALQDEDVDIEHQGEELSKEALRNMDSEEMLEEISNQCKEMEDTQTCEFVKANEMNVITICANRLLDDDFDGNEEE